jgi:hypothetical protein
MEILTTRQHRRSRSFLCLNSELFYLDLIFIVSRSYLRAYRMSRASNDEQYFLAYDQFQVHELMLRDRARVTAYHDAMMHNRNLFDNKVTQRTVEHVHDKHRVRARI